MAGTIQQIAELAGVSRGTVDRALNNRGRINPEVAKQIWQIADEIGYVPKHQRKKEQEQKKLEETYRIGVVTQLSNSPFMIQVNKGIYDAAERLLETGVQVIVKEKSFCRRRSTVEIHSGTGRSRDSGTGNHAGRL